MVNNSVINYQNILLDNLDEPTNITFSTPSSLNSLVTKRKTSFTVNGPHIKKYQIASPNFDGSYSGNKKNAIYQIVTHQVHLILYLF